MSAVSDKFSVNDKSTSSPIKDFYVGKTVFLTGCTGAVGEVVLEKLLRYVNGVSVLITYQSFVKIAKAEFND